MVSAGAKGYLLYDCMNSDAFMIKKAPLLYCFRYKLNEYCIPKGKYRVQKSFSRGDEHILLTDSFEVK